jgi:hypothetical protein
LDEEEARQAQNSSEGGEPGESEESSNDVSRQKAPSTPVFDPNRECPFSQLAWTLSESNRLASAPVEIQPGKAITIEVPPESIRPENKELLLRLNDHFDELKKSFGTLYDRISAHVASWWDSDGFGTDDDDEYEDDEYDDEDEDHESIKDPVAVEPTPSKTVPLQFDLVRITLERPRTHYGRVAVNAQLHFEVLGFDEMFALSISDDFARSQERPELTVVDPILGRFQLKHKEHEHPDRYDPGLIPQGYVWDGREFDLWPLETADDFEKKPTFGAAIEQLQALLGHARKAKQWDRAPFLEEIADFLIGEGYNGPWIDYDYFHTDEEKLEESLYPDDIRKSLRWRDLYQILSHAGLPGVVLFADGSAILICSHRTSFKSDVFIIHVMRDRLGALTGAATVQVYWGE